MFRDKKFLPICYNQCNGWVRNLSLFCAMLELLSVGSDFTLSSPHAVFCAKRRKLHLKPSISVNTAQQENKNTHTHQKLSSLDEQTATLNRVGRVDLYENDPVIVRQICEAIYHEGKSHCKMAFINLPMRAFL